MSGEKRNPIEYSKREFFQDCRFIRCNGNMLFSCFIGGILSTNFSDSSKSIANIDIQSNIALLRLQGNYYSRKWISFVKFIFIHFHNFHYMRLSVTKRWIIVPVSKKKINKSLLSASHRKINSNRSKHVWMSCEMDGLRFREYEGKNQRWKKKIEYINFEMECKNYIFMRIDDIPPIRLIMRNKIMHTYVN